MKNEQRGVAITIADILNFVGGVSGLVALATLVFMGGSVVEKVRSLDGRVTAIERAGSTPLQAHIASDERMDEAHAARLKMLEENIININRIEAKLESVATKLDMVKEQLTSHVNNRP